MATKSEVSAKALRLLGVVGVGRLPSGPQTADMLAAYDELYAELSGLELVEWTSTGDIPAKYVDVITNLTASRRIDDYAVSNERYQRIMSKAAGAEARIRRIMSDKYISSTTSFTDY